MSENQEKKPTIIEEAVEKGAEIVSKRTGKPLLVVLNDTEKESEDKQEVHNAEAAKKAKRKIAGS